MATDYRFLICSAEKQRLLLKALDQLRDEGETAEESALVTEMIHDLEAIERQRSARRRRGRPVAA